MCSLSNPLLSVHIFIYTYICTQMGLCIHSHVCKILKVKQHYWASKAYFKCCRRSLFSHFAMQLPRGRIPNNFTDIEQTQGSTAGKPWTILQSWVSLIKSFTGRMLVKNCHSVNGGKNAKEQKSVLEWKQCTFLGQELTEGSWRGKEKCKMAIRERWQSFKRCFSFRKVSSSLSAEAIPEKILLSFQAGRASLPTNSWIPCAKCKVTSHLHATSRSAFCKQCETSTTAADITKLITSSIRKVAEGRIQNKLLLYCKTI